MTIANSPGLRSPLANSGEGEAGIPPGSASQPLIMDMASAPRDGSRFWGIVNGNAIRMFWHSGFGEFVTRFNRMELAPGYTFEDGSTFRDHSPEICRPTAWMHIPAALGEEGDRG
ncbi:hypothetical protein V5F77_02695 [Xanthobacter sp. DSM 24535]|uniref:hypothetical protein n=1 Tax=Roseixanthobacter psychrophilus TaxID=3119917 RepID=UPI00372C6844